MIDINQGYIEKGIIHFELLQPANMVSNAIIKKNILIIGDQHLQLAVN